MKSKIKCSCKDCKGEAGFFHSCCGLHFEGVFEKGLPYIACEKCGRYMGSVFVEKKLLKKKFKI